MGVRSLVFALVAGLLALAPQAAFAQHGPDLDAQRAAMARIAGMAGDWQGVADVQFPAPRTVYQTEHIVSDMNGLLLVIHGNGYDNQAHSGDPIFNAFGVISYDDARQIYEFRVYNDGRAATAEAHFLDNGSLQWSMNFAPVLIRYTITLGANSWHQVGEMSRDNGATWTQTIDMNLTRVQ